MNVPENHLSGIRKENLMDTVGRLERKVILFYDSKTEAIDMIKVEEQY